MADKENSYPFEMITKGTVKAASVGEAREKVHALLRKRENVEFDTPEVRIEMAKKENATTA